jgi:hypothetical protein
MTQQAPTWLQIGYTVLPAIVAAIVGGFTVWLGNRQLKRSSELAEKQMQLSAKAANDQFSATLSAANMNYRAQVLSTNRQVWINAIRDDISSLIGKAGSIGIHGEKYPPEKLISIFSEMAMLSSRIRLRLNPTENLSKQIDKAIAELIRICFSRPTETKALTASFLQLEGYTGALIKAEWERVKRGE